MYEETNIILWQITGWVQLFLTAYYIMIIVSSSKQKDNVKTPNYLFIYGIFGALSSVLGFIFTVGTEYIMPINFIFNNVEIIFLAIIQFGLTLIGLIFFIIFSANNTIRFRFFLLITSILLLIELILMLLLNIMIDWFSVGFFILLDSKKKSLISTLIVIIAIIFLVIHGFHNKDNYIIIGGFLYIMGSFLWFIYLLT
ncbi:MAG: hypothetical protein EU518_01930 [Promethearchaeota archaeon]|nr:MAG: hypothetical protein EU518_01930 [Candidatus Lokiarchaeota archaeon]